MALVNMTISESVIGEELNDPDEYFEVSELDVYLDEDSNLIVHSMEVADESDDSPLREATQNKISSFQKALEWRKDWKKPKVFNHELIHLDRMNPISVALFGDEQGPSRQFPCLREWIESAPSAKALTPMYYPFETRLVGDALADGEFNGAEIDENSHNFFLNGLDAIAIRTRARLLETIANNDLSGDAKKWVSLACGAAIPVFNALGTRTSEIHLDLVDIDPEALAFAGKLAKKRELIEGEHYDLIESDLDSELMRGDQLLNRLGVGETDLVDMMGIFEYFRPDTAALLLKRAYELVKPGGTIVIANMLSDRPQLDFNERGVGWPGIFPRSLKEIGEIIEDSGITSTSVDVYIPQDGVYAVVEIKK